ncbi:MAG TPA: hypothetical protein VGM04_04955 [Sphingomicrobium sp.]|jgi:hypothetical protein
MNWAYFALAVSACLVLAWLWQVSRRRWDWVGLYVSVGCVIAACFNAAAPVRGLLDPNYVGYTFGFAEADKGVGVTLVAGAIFLSCAASALIAPSGRSGPPLWIVALTCAGMFLVVGVATIRDAVASPAANAIQFGEYLTVPGMMATTILLLSLTGPFAVGAVWAAARSLS